ncbi:MAG TPA: hypothetical protein VHC21_02860 [Candidatus Saccharimonadales bacterium]|nr:hypothetical protein [Candidatus Saccharimonadales bacterium]
MQRKYFLTLLGLSLIFAITVYTTPASDALLHKYHLTLAQLRIIDTLVILPLIAIWAVAFYGASILERYALSIKRHKDGAALRTISYGVSILAIGTTATSVISSLFGYYDSKHLKFIRPQVIVNNYLTLLITLAAFIFIYRGAVRLAELTSKKIQPGGSVVYNAAYVALAVLYTYLFFNHLSAATHIPLSATSHAAYYTPTGVTVATLLIPYLISWYLGSLAVHMMWLYQRHIGGKLYAHDINFLTLGLGIIIAGSILTQILTVLTSQLQSLSTAAVIALAYCLLTIIAAGYVPIAVGVKKLADLEKI